MSERQDSDYRRVLEYIATQPAAAMGPLVMHWFPSAPQDAAFPADVKPFTRKPRRGGYREDHDFA
jgi:hypothetical protein